MNYLIMMVSIVSVLCSGCGTQAEELLESSESNSSSSERTPSSVEESSSSEAFSSSISSGGEEFSSETESSDVVSSSSEFSEESSVAQNSSSSLTSVMSSSSIVISSSDVSSSSEGAVVECTNTQTAGRQWVMLNVDGIDRNVLFYIPTGHNNSAQSPMTFNLHGTTGNPEDHSSWIGIEALADQHGYILASILGDNNEWNTPQDDSKPHDVHFASAIIKHATDNFCLDTNRIFSTGYSGGARTSSRFACDIPNQIRAIAPVAGIRYDEPCEESTMPIITFHSRDDGTNPFLGNGSGDTRWGETVEEAVEDWRVENGCSDTMDSDTSVNNVEKRSWTDCDGEAEIHFYVVENEGHDYFQVEGITEKIFDFFNTFQ